MSLLGQNTTWALFYVAVSLCNKISLCTLLIGVQDTEQSRKAQKPSKRIVDTTTDEKRFMGPMWGLYSQLLFSTLVVKEVIDMKAAYNTTADFIDGPSTASPGVVRFTAPVRVVLETQQLPQCQPLTMRVAYVTNETDQPRGPQVTVVGEVYTTDYGFADLIAVPSGGTAVFQVLFVELVVPDLLVSYYRAHVRYRPGLSALEQESLEFLLQETGSLLLLP